MGLGSFSIFLFLLFLLIEIWTSCHKSIRSLLRESLSNKDDLFDKNYVSSISDKVEATLDEMRSCLAKATDVQNSSVEMPVKQPVNRTGFLGGLMNLLAAGANYVARVNDNNNKYDSIKSFYKQFSNCYLTLYSIFDIIQDLSVEVKTGGRQDIHLLSQILRKYNRKISMDLHCVYDPAVISFLDITPDMIERNSKAIESYQSDTLQLGVKLLNSNVDNQSNRSGASYSLNGLVAVGTLALGAIETHFERQRMKSESALIMINGMQEDLQKAIDAQKTINAAIEMLLLVNNYHKVFIGSAMRLADSRKSGSSSVGLIPVLEKLAVSYSGATTISVQRS